MIINSSLKLLYKVSAFAVATVICFGPWSFSMLAGQATQDSKRAETFHIHGAIRSYTKVSASGSEIKFNSKGFTTELTTDLNGNYGANLPLGTYSMDVQPPAQYHGRYLQAYDRPWFTVSTSSDVVLNVVLRPVANCDAVPVAPARTLNEDERKDACGGSDMFPLASEQNVPFQVLIQYSHRRASDRGFVYSGWQIPGTAIKFPVSVAYNLFSLQADSVIYDKQDRVLEASGDVTVEEGSGDLRHPHSLAVKLENGQAVPLHQ